MAMLDSAASPAARLTAARHAERLAGAENLAQHYVLAAAGLALVPVPLADLLGVMALQVKLVHGLARHYGVPFKASLVQSLLAALLSGPSATLAGRALASLAKAVPGLGSLAGGGTAVSFAAVTYAVGAIFIQHFEAGGILLDFDAQKAKPLFRHALLTGPATATPTGAEPPIPASGNADRRAPAPVTGRLEDINGIGKVYASRLREAGVTGFAELAATPTGRVKEIVEREFPVSAKTIQSWIGQAAALAAQADRP